MGLASCELWTWSGKCNKMSNSDIKKNICDNKDLQKAYDVKANCCACGGGNNYLWMLIVFPLCGVLCYGACFYYMCCKPAPAPVVVVMQPG